MTSDEPDDIIRYNLDDHDGDDLPARSYWWSLHRPETYAIAALTIASGSLLTLAPIQELVRAILDAVTNTEERITIIALSGSRLVVSLIAMFAAVLSIRSEDEDTTWSAPVARAALLVAALSAVIATGSIIVAALTSTQPQNTPF